MKKVHSGFTLVELVTVVILLAIVSVVVLPKFSSRSGYGEYAVRDQIISSFRFAQQRAMYDHSGNCYRLNIDASGFGPQREGSYFGPVEEVFFSEDYAAITVDPPQEIYFDGLGNAFEDDCGNGTIDDPLTLTIGPANIKIEIFPSGYIRAI